MKQIHPFTSFQEAITKFDNGGHFYNLFSHAKDGVVSPAELDLIAETDLNKQQLILFLVMSICKMDNRSREKVLARLDGELFEMFEKYRPVHITIAQMIERGKPGISVTMVGTPKKISGNDENQGHVLIPIAVGSETSFSLVPITESFVIYELHSEYTHETVIIGHPKEKTELPERKIRVGGMLTALNEQDPGSSNKNGVFLEVQYYLEEE
ncbi:hypothetical protein [Algoriphagus sp. AK58]|uniref:hypothetical protein n=1 Tax=Algoriphagus sp. AK58 TaxID=1406877 RepID=UPI00165019CA|nr:hypothetical protein [Algoriphagus sp. AK58]MBC6369002.1 hypothetical protein [Algoriphagus sp. AK58]